MTLYIIAFVLVSLLLLCARWIGVATGEQRAAQRMKVGREQLQQRTAAARERRWLQNGEALEIFERAFSDRTAGCARRCDCGIQYYNPDNGWDFDDGELETYRSDPSSRPLEWAVGAIYFEGRYFVPDCECWKPRATRIVAFIHEHDKQIAEFLSLEKARLEYLAQHAPTVTKVAS